MKFTNRSTTEDELIPIDIEGTRLSNGEPWEVHLRVMPRLPAAAMMALPALVGSMSPDQKAIADVGVAMQIVASLFYPPDIPLFEELCNDTDRSLDIATLTAILDFVIPRVTGVPFVAPTGSPASS